MTTETLAPESQSLRHEELTDLVGKFASPVDLPAAEWLKRYSLSVPDAGLKTLRLETRVAKRLMDLILATSLLILLAPVLLVVALLIKWSSPGPVLFKQVRVGLNLRAKKPDRRNSSTSTTLRSPDFAEERRTAAMDRRFNASHGKPFTLYKLRSMKIDAESNGACFAVAGDPRVTSIGRFLRKTRLDEIPQLWNVLRGEMSLVGPRPERPEFIEELSAQIPGYLHRLRLKPGLTGLAQVVNGYDNNLESFRKKVALDLLYLQNCSIWNDLKICLRTVGVILTGKGAL